MEKRNSDSIFYNLENDTFRENGDILSRGDFNSRAEGLHDFIDHGNKYVQQTFCKSAHYQSI